MLLVAGGLSSLQTAAIASALPFSVALLCAIWGFARALQVDATKRNVLQSVVPSAVDGVDWRRRLANLLRYPGDNAVQRFEQEVVLPALGDFASELKEHGVQCRVLDQVAGQGAVRLEVYHGGELDFLYEIRCRAYAMPGHAVAGTALGDLEERDKFYRAEVHLAEGGQDYDVMGWSREQLTVDVLQQYENHLQFLHALR